MNLAVQDIAGGNRTTERGHAYRLGSAMYAHLGEPGAECAHCLMLGESPANGANGRFELPIATCTGSTGNPSLCAVS